MFSLCIAVILTSLYGFIMLQTEKIWTQTKLRKIIKISVHVTGPLSQV